MRHFDETQITITLKPIYIERIVYWVIILALAILLVMSWMDESAPTNQTVDQPAAGNVLQPPVVQEPAVQEPVETTPAESCSDGVKNQDETDVDCGGSCGGCASGYVCKSASDCIADYCVSGKCTNTAPVELSGKLEVDLQKVETTTNADSGAVKIHSVKFKVMNGLQDDVGPLTVQVWTKKKGTAGVCVDDYQGDCDTPYTSISLPGLDSGQSVLRTETIDGKYLPSPTAQYTNGDSFDVWLYVYDAAGEEVGGKTITDFMNVRP